MAFCVDDYGHLGLSTKSTCQPMYKNQPLPRSRGFCAPCLSDLLRVPGDFPRPLCICTGERCVHPVHLFTKLGTCPLTKSGGFPTPCPSDTPRVPGGFRGAGAVHHPWPPLVGGASLRPSRLAAHRSYNPMATSAAAPAGIYPLGELISNGGRGRYVKVRVTGVTGVTPSIKLLIILNIVALHALKPRDL